MPQSKTNLLTSYVVEGIAHDEEPRIGGHHRPVL